MATNPALSAPMAPSDRWGPLVEHLREYDGRNAHQSIGGDARVCGVGYGGDGRAGFDEKKCRSVLVRHCSHVPRNYQYSDGIEKIFLILRDQLGDESLCLAGGVLYELIEVDCQYMDDAGAAFQRWRHAHMNQNNGLLAFPHVSHLSAITTTAITPTSALGLWRETHPERYSARLSNYALSTDWFPADAGCIRNRTPWIIDHTMYVSSNKIGTRPHRAITAKEYREIQWNIRAAQKDRLANDKAIVALTRPMESDLENPSPVPSVGPKAAALEPSPPKGAYRRYKSVTEWISKSVGSVNSSRSDSSRASWFLTLPGIGPTVAPGGFVQASRIPLPDGRRIPNAIFARKHGFVSEGQPLPSSSAFDVMPTAESKVAEAMVDEAVTASPPLDFRGPLTPELGFDDDLDFEWASPPAQAVRNS